MNRCPVGPSTINKMHLFYELRFWGVDFLSINLDACDFILDACNLIKGEGDASKRIFGRLEKNP